MSLLGGKARAGRPGRRQGRRQEPRPASKWTWRLCWPKEGLSRRQGIVAALIVNSFTASSDASLWLRKTLGIMSVPELMLTWISPSYRGRMCGLTKGGAA